MQLAPGEVNRLASSLVDGGLFEVRDTIVSALRPRSRAGLKRRDDALSQLFADLDGLNTTPIHIGGYPAFDVYLSRAHELAQDDDTRLALQAALAAVRVPERGVARPLDSAPLAESEVRPVPPEMAGHLEALTGAGDVMLRIDFLSVGVERARSVVRIRCPDGRMGTGFLLASGWIATNAHVLPDPAAARGALADFGYEDTRPGESRIAATVALAPERGFRCSPVQGGDDLTLVASEGPAPAGFGPLPLPAAGARVPAPGDPVHIVQHPNGGPKRLVVYRNLVTWAGNGRVQYLTDTLPGSSGSPVFDREWNLVAVHHAGSRSPPAGAGVNTVANEGIAVERLFALLG